MTPLQNLVEQPLVHRFGLMLLHFLWQGAAVAVLAALALRLLRHRSAQLRYAASTAGLVVMAVLPAVTFWLIEPPAGPTGAAPPDMLAALGSPEQVEPGGSWRARTAAAAAGGESWRTDSAAGSAQTGIDASGRTGAAAPPAADEPASTRWLRTMDWTGGVRALLPWTVVAWAAGVLILSARLAGGWMYVVRLRRRSTRRIGEPLAGTAGRLCRRLGIRRTVSLLESAAVTVPCALGVLRPVVLLPASALTGLSPQQLESLLAHELAHVRRYDYLVNALQCIVETLLFYHPAVWWLSRRIRAERENCCDDLAVAVVGSRLVYAQALTQMADLGRRQYQLAVAGSGSDLAGRVRRLLDVSPSTPQWLSPWWAGAVLLAILAGVLVIFGWNPAVRPARADSPEAAQTEAESPAAADSEDAVEPAAGERAFRLADEFDGKLALDWDVMRLDPTHVSLEKNPGKLTITVQRGSFHGDPATATDKVPPKNVYLLRNPASEGAGFVMTTCITSFHPKVPYQQAGLVVYDDDDNYLKWVMERARNSPSFTFIRETDQQPTSDYNGIPDEPNLHRVWLRLMKRAAWYQYSYSTNGEQYTVVGEEVWGTGAPQWVGILAKVAQADDEMDAAFDSFEIRSLTPEERDDPEFAERQTLYGTWEVVAGRFDGKSLDAPPLSRFAFAGNQVTVTEGAGSIQSQCTFDAEKDPKQMLLAGVFAGGRAPVRAAYSVEGDRLAICFHPSPQAPAPDKLETSEGDGRFLVTLRRMSADEVAAVERMTRPAKNLFESLDRDHDESLTAEEYTAGRTAPESVRQGAALFEVLDRDRDGKLTLAELQSKPRRAVFMLGDSDADGGWSAHEFFFSEMRNATAKHAQRVFDLVDKDDDGTVRLEEFLSRTSEAWFVKLDTSEDDRLSYSEYAAGNQALVRNNRCRPVYDAIDRNGDGGLSLEEFDRKPPEAVFGKQDADADGKLSFEEFTSWRNTPEQVAAAKQDFAKKDTDLDGRLSFKEYAYRPADAEFWKRDQNGDDRLSLEEYRAGRPPEEAGQAESAFKSLDQNGDGSLSLGEFRTRPDGA